jgi:hypothetical protein
VSKAKQTETGLKKKKGRGRAKHSIELIQAMYVAAKEVQPVTGRGIGYILFVKGLIPSMGRNPMQTVYRLLREAREEGLIPWEWIVDETRGIERVETWDDPAQFARIQTRFYRKDFWLQQPHRVIVASEKGTIRGILDPVLDEYAVGFSVLHGFDSATDVHDLCTDTDGRPLIILYVGDWDPSGLCMSLVDLPKRIAKYGGKHIKLRRIALTKKHLVGLPSFPASDKRADTRYNWFVENHGDRCWEIDAMNPNVLRNLVKREIIKLIEPTAWARCERVNEAERKSLEQVLTGWARTRKKEDAV